MNRNTIITTDFSNLTTKTLYHQRWKDDPKLRHLYENGAQCGGCSFYAPFNTDYGLCCHPQSPHVMETTFEHFACLAYVDEGWGPHSFSVDEARKCHCQGEPIYKTMETIMLLLDRKDLSDELNRHLWLLQQYLGNHYEA